MSESMKPPLVEVYDHGGIDRPSRGNCYIDLAEVVAVNAYRRSSHDAALVMRSGDIYTVSGTVDGWAKLVNEAREGGSQVSDGKPYPIEHAAIADLALAVERLSEVLASSESVSDCQD